MSFLLMQILPLLLVVGLLLYGGAAAIRLFGNAVGEGAGRGVAKSRLAELENEVALLKVRMERMESLRSSGVPQER